MTCPTCNGTGFYNYTTRGTTHGKLCEDCCPHNEGFWKLEEHYGKDNGKWCCRIGCGYVTETLSIHKGERL